MRARVSGRRRSLAPNSRGEDCAVRRPPQLCFTFGPCVTFACSMDTMILAFRHAYEGGSAYTSPAEFDPVMHNAAHALVRLAIIVMANVIA